MLLVLVLLLLLLLSSQHPVVVQTKHFAKHLWGEALPYWLSWAVVLPSSRERAPRMEHEELNQDMWACDTHREAFFLDLSKLCNRNQQECEASSFRCMMNLLATAAFFCFVLPFFPSISGSSTFEPSRRSPPSAEYSPSSGVANAVQVAALRSRLIPRTLLPHCRPAGRFSSLLQLTCTGKSVFAFCMRFAR